MIRHKTSVRWGIPIIIGVSLLTLFALPQTASAITALPTPDPIPGSYGLEATKTQPAPTVGASISTPGSGASFTTSPITISGICPTDLLVEVYDNSVMVGAVVCTNGSFSLQVSLFAGTNDLTVIDYDDLGQAGPTSSTVTVTYTDTHLTAFGELITLTSPYGRRSAATGAPLSYPLQLSGGLGPYAFSIDWGDGSSADLKSQSLAGVVTIDHTFKTAGIYTLNVKVTDVNGVSAFLQVVGVASGKVAGDTNTATTAAKTVTTIIWIPAVIAVLLIPVAYWLGRRSEVVSLRNKMLRDRDSV
jgi:hypothetical protein